MIYIKKTLIPKMNKIFNVSKDVLNAEYTNKIKKIVSKLNSSSLVELLAGIKLISFNIAV